MIRHEFAFKPVPDGSFMERQYGQIKILLWIPWLPYSIYKAKEKVEMLKWSLNILDFYVLRDSTPSFTILEYHVINIKLGPAWRTTTVEVVKDTAVWEDCFEYFLTTSFEY